MKVKTKESNMIQKNELECLIEKTGLVCFETEMSFEDDIHNIVYLKNKDISELFKFAEANGIRAVFYCYNHYDKDLFRIDDEMLSEYDERLINAVKRGVVVYNKEVSMLDFSRPMRLYVYCVYQGCSISIILEDYWIEDMNIPTAEEKLDDLLEECDAVFEEITVEKKNEKETLRNRLKELILADSHFYECTNQKLRRTYILNLLQEKTEFSNAFSFYIEPIEFVEFIWKEYKSNK
jgi:hypothetical protein